MLENRGIKILGTGSFKPDFVVKNDDFSGFLETDDEWISSRTGIKQRRLNLGGTNSSMSIAASKRALAAANISPNEIDMIIASTSSPDYFYPSLSCLIQGAIGAENAGAFDLSAACSGFVYALDSARVYLSFGEHKKILVVAGEMVSRQADFTDRSSCVLFGDGAGAVVVEAADSLFSSYLGATGEGYDDPKIRCRINYKGNNPFEKNNHINDKSSEAAFIEMKGREVYKYASDIMPKAVIEVCDRAGIDTSEIDLLIPHQANLRIIKTAVKRLGIPEDRVYTNIEKTGNISSACIPVCFDELYRAGRITAGMKICIVGFGGGLTYGSILFEA